jgi:hypothetical protein
MSATATAPVLYVQPQSEIEQIIAREKTISPEELPESYRQVDDYEDPAISAEMEDFVQENGKTVVRRQRTIADVHAGTYKYCWLDEKMKKDPRWTGYAFVQKEDCPASVGPCGVAILPHYFDKRGIIQRGGVFYCYAKAGFAAEHKQRAARDLAEQQSQVIFGGATLDSRDASGALVEGVETRGPDSKKVKRG